MKIKFIYFDVGGVLIKDFSKTNKWDDLLNKLGVTNEDKIKINQLFDEEELKYCAGEKHCDTFLDIAKDEFNIDMGEEYSLQEEIASQFEPNPELTKIVLDLKQKYPLGLLTNMYPDMLKLIKSKNLLPEVDWDITVDSSLVGFQKPETEIYNYAVKKAGFSENEILFIDNTLRNVEGAEKLGWNTILYDPSDIEGSNRKILKFLNLHT